MKKILTFTLIGMLCFSLISCSEGSKENTSTQQPTEAAETYALPTGYRYYDNGNLRFAYPEEWERTTSEGVTLLKAEKNSNGNNVTIARDPYSDEYLTMTDEEFETSIKSSYESVGMSVKSCKVTQVENEFGVKMTKLTCQTKADYSEWMNQTAFVIAAGSFNYTITVTEAVSDASLVDAVFQSLRALK